MEVKTETNQFEMALQKIEGLTRENYRLRRENYRLEEEVKNLSSPQPQVVVEDDNLIDKVNEIFAEADAAMDNLSEKNIKEAKKYAKQK